MKTVTKLAMIFSFATFMFAGVSFSVSNHYTEATDGDYLAARTFGIAFDVNDKTTLGWNGDFGMMSTFDLPLGAELRLGYNGSDTSFGLGYNWWSGGDAIKTSIGTSVDYSKGAEDEGMSVDLNVGFGW